MPYGYVDVRPEPIQGSPAAVRTVNSHIASENDRDVDSLAAAQPRNSPFGWDSALSLSGKAQAGAIGKFYQALQPLGSTLDLSQFHLPRLVCIGNQSAGKSSLLESITKCHIFPRGRSTTTRAPVCLTLEHAKPGAEPFIEVSFGDGPVSRLPIEDYEDALVKAVSKIMDRIPVNVIETQSIKVHICKHDVPSMEIIDLPGLKETQEEARTTTYGLVDKYLAEEGTLVLCVVDARMTSFESCQALRAVLRHQKAAKTIITLTKADRLHRSEVAEALVWRVLRPDAELHSPQPFQDCVAVINRQHQDTVTLLEAGNEELRTFENTIFQGYRFQSEQEEHSVKERITIDNLILQIEQLYYDYVKYKWQPIAGMIIDGRQTSTQQKLNDLGKAPGPELTVEQVLCHASSFIEWSALAASILGPHPMICLPDGHHLAQGYSRPASLSHAAQWLLPSVPADSLEHVEFSCQLAEAVREAIDDWLADPSYIDELNFQLDRVFAKPSHMHLERFLELKEVLQARLPQVIKPADIRRSVLQDLEPQLTLIKLGHWLPGRPLNCALAKLDRAARFGVFQRYILPLKRSGIAHMAPQGFQLRESPAYQAKRAELEQRASNLALAKNIIQRIHEEMGGAAASGSQSAHALCLSSAKSDHCGIGQLETRQHQQSIS